MENELISKKELLELTQISYGQLYRWKRKNLIPEEWFIRKSTYTGQETFFPKEKIIDRIEKIKNMKGDISLDNLAEMLSANLMEITLEKDDLLEHNIVSKTTLDFYTDKKGDSKKHEFETVLFLYLLDKLFEEGTINYEEGNMILEILEKYYSKFKAKSCVLLFLRKLGISSCCLVSNVAEIYFENNTKIIAKINIMRATIKNNNMHTK